MGRRQATVAGLVTRAQANGYERGAHKERDKILHHPKHVKKTMKDQDAILTRYVLYV